jgi:membrane associated rhomboid family serine protease
MERAPALNLPQIVLWLSVALVAVHGLRQFLDEDADLWVLLAFAFIPARYGEAAAFLPGGVAACLWTPLTYAFLHADWLHLFVNLIWMASFGGALARRFGAVRFLALSALAAVAGAAVHYAFHAGEEELVVGASGAVSGMMAATARFAFVSGGPLAGGGSNPASYRIRAASIAAVFANSRSLSFILIWFGVNLLFGLSSGLVPGVSGPIAWEAHVGGFLAGLLVFPLLDSVREGEPLAS